MIPFIIKSFTAILLYRNFNKTCYFDIFMKWSTKRLILLYLGLVIIKSVLSYLIASPGEFSDSYEYMKMARSFFFSQQFLIHGTPSHHYPPLYPMALSLSYIFNNPETVYFVMKIINSILSPLIIFPTYLLAKKLFNLLLLPFYLPIFHLVIILCLKTCYTRYLCFLFILCTKY